MYTTTHLNVSLVAGHREVPLPVAGAEGGAVPGPLLPRRHVLLADAAVLHPDHPAAEPDAAEHAEAARVRVQVGHHLAVVREHLRDGLRPREVRVLVQRPRRLQRRAVRHARPHAAEDGVGLEDDGAAAALQEVLARGQAAHAGADDGHPLLVHDHTALAGLVGIGSARETTRAVAVG